MFANPRTHRDYPWHTRLATHEHGRWFSRLAMIHELTHLWITELKMDKKPDISRGLSPSIVENLWMLDSLENSEVDAFLDDTHPEDVLGRLENTVWAAQAYTVRKFFENASSSEQPALMNVLEQTAWRFGRKIGETRWATSVGQTIPADDLRVQTFACADIPFLQKGPQHETILTRRAVRDEVQMEFLMCAHQIGYPDVAPEADRLCRLHAQWIRGFAYGMNHRISVETFHKGGSNARCGQIWTLIRNVPEAEK